MKNLQKYLSLIRSFTTQIRSLQTQNGYSQSQIDGYLVQVIKSCLNLQYNHEKCVGNWGQGNFEKFLIWVIGGNSRDVQIVLMRIIEALDVELYVLSQRNIEQKITKIQYNKEHQQQTPAPILRSKRYQFHISTDQLQLQPRQPHHSTPSPKISPYQQPLIITPRQKYSNLHQWFKQTQDTNNELDTIERSIQQTLQRTRKLRRFLHMKNIEEKELEISRERDMEVQRIKSIDRELEREIQIQRSVSRIKFQGGFEKFQSIFID